MTNIRSDLLHVDLDAFYASVERLHRPETVGAALIVGGGGGRGVVLSCSYEARAHGVRNGMPSFRARKLCPAAIFVPPDFSRYKEASRSFMEVLQSFTPVIEPISMDEAFCDISGAHRLFGSAEDIARMIRDGVVAATGLACSVGGGDTKLVAKLASRAAKPDGVVVVHDSLPFLHALPLSDLWGVGKTTTAKLTAIGLRTVGDVACAPVGVLRAAVGEQAGTSILAMANNTGDSIVRSGVAGRSVSASETFESDLDDEELLGAHLLRLSDRVAARLAAADTSGRTVTVRIRLADFSNFTRSKTLEYPVRDVWTIHGAATEAFAGFKRGRRRVRLLGVGMSQLVDGPVPRQDSLEGGSRYAQAESAVTRVRKRFGSDAVSLARLIEPGSPPPRGPTG